MIDRDHDLPLVRQARVPGLARGSVYYQRRPVPAEELAIMRRLDELHLDYPFAGSRMLRDFLRAGGVEIGRCRAITLMRRMGIRALYRRPNTSKPAPGHQVLPYLLRGMKINRPNQVWAMDITYIPMARGFVHLAAVVDWDSRRVLAWRLSITMTADFRIEAVEEALAKHGRPEILNTGQGSQFTSGDFVGPLAANRIEISMDGKGSWRDNLRPLRGLSHRAPVALGQVRGGLLEGLRQRSRGPRLTRPPLRLPQQPKAAYEPRRQDARPGLF
jgi:putative transposase